MSTAPLGFMETKYHRFRSRALRREAGAGLVEEVILSAFFMVTVFLVAVPDLGATIRDLFGRTGETVCEAGDEYIYNNLAVTNVCQISQIPISAQ